MNLTLNPKTKDEIDIFLGSPTHALLLVGPLGSGKGALASFIATKVLDVSENRLEVYPHFRRLITTGSSISIEDVRNLHNFTSLRTPGKSDIRRVVILEKLETMTLEAQNAFLKLLEEPPVDTMFVMTANDVNVLLPTVLSRTRKIIVLPPDKLELADFFNSQGHTDKEIEQVLNISGGLPGLATAILDSDKEHILVSQIDVAKRLISSTKFERLLEISNLTKEKPQLPVLLMALRRVVRSILVQAVKAHRTDEIVKWHKALSEIVKTEAMLPNNPHPKLLLTNLFINL